MRCIATLLVLILSNFLLAQDFPEGRVVIGEEATGTWCGFCPKGAVYLEKMHKDFGEHFQGIAVHHDDPMADAGYDSGMYSRIGGSYPRVMVDRGKGIDPKSMMFYVRQQLKKEPSALLSHGTVFDEETRKLQVSVTYNFKADISGDWRVACAIIEDGVTGTGDGYIQTNYYGNPNGGWGEMGGYENKPEKIPAKDMVYEHVARGISPSFNGKVNAFPNGAKVGDEETFNFEFTLHEDWDITKIKVIGMLINPEAMIDNAGVSGVEGYESNGFEEGIEIDGNIELSQPDDLLRLKTIDFNIFQVQTEQSGRISVYDFSGKMVFNQSISKIESMNINANSLSKGIYFVRFNTSNKQAVKKIIVQ